jgi:hypothetical protein
MSDDVKKALEELERGPGYSQWHTDVIRHHLDGEPARLAAAVAAAREEQREADARGCEDGEVCRCDSIDSDAQCGHCLGEAFAATVRAMPLDSTPLGDELAQVRRERDALKVRALGAEARVMELEEEQEARDEHRQVGGGRHSRLGGSGGNVAGGIQRQLDFFALLRDTLQCEAVTLQVLLKLDVREGDTLESIALRRLGDQAHAAAIARNNRLAGLAAAPGDRLTIPR